jgi:hypothetical protein
MKRAGLLLFLAGTTVVLAQGPPGGWGGRGRGMGGPGGPAEMFGLMAAGPASRTPVTGAPYAGTEISQIQQKLADGNVITRTEQSKVYRDKDGRVRIEHTTTPPASSGQSPQTRITIFDPVASVSYMLDPATSTAIKHTIPSGNAMAMRQRPAGRMQNSANPPETTDLGTTTVNGLQATGTKTVRTIPAGTIGNAQPIVITREAWISTALQIPVKIITSDPRFGTTEMDLTSVTQGDQDPSLFQVPSGYTTNAAPMGRGPGRTDGMARRPPR